MSLVFGMLICMNEKNKAAFFLLEGVSYSLNTQVMLILILIDVQYLQKANGASS